MITSPWQSLMVTVFAVADEWKIAVVPQGDGSLHVTADKTAGTSAQKLAEDVRAFLADITSPPYYIELVTEEENDDGLWHDLVVLRHGEAA